MDSVLKSVLQEELERNLQKQIVFTNELFKYPKGSLVIVNVHNDRYVYRKYRLKDKVVSEYIGPVDSDAAKTAYEEREKYLKYKKDLKDLKKEEINLRKAIKVYD